MTIFMFNFIVAQCVKGRKEGLWNFQLFFFLKEIGKKSFIAESTFSVKGRKGKRKRRKRREGRQCTSRI